MDSQLFLSPLKEININIHGSTFNHRVDLTELWFTSTMPLFKFYTDNNHTNMH